MNNIKTPRWFLLFKFLLFQQKNLQFHEKEDKNKDSCGIVLSTQKSNVLEYNRYIKSDKMPFIIHGK